LWHALAQALGFGVFEPKVLTLVRLGGFGVFNKFGVFGGSVVQATFTSMAVASARQTEGTDLGNTRLEPKYVIETREALNESRYSQTQFQVYYGDGWESYWDDSAHTSDATQLIASVRPDPIGVAVVRQAEGEHINDVPELVTPARLDPTHVIAIRQAEAARGKPRSLHNIARDALNTISKRENYGTINLDGCFPWRQYVAAHAQSSDIIDPGITHAEAVFVKSTRDTNRGGLPRLDFFFYRSD